MGRVAPRRTDSQDDLPELVGRALLTGGTPRPRGPLEPGPPEPGPLEPGSPEPGSPELDPPELDPRDPNDLRAQLYAPGDALRGHRRLRIHRWHHLSLSAVLPSLSDLGVEVVDERSHRLLRPDGRTIYVHDYGLHHPGTAWARDAQATGDTHRRFCEALTAVLGGLTESDPLHGLVLGAGLTHRRIEVLRAYTRYLRQVRTPRESELAARALAAHPGPARDLVDLFELRFDPDRFAPEGNNPSEPDPSREEALTRAVHRLHRSLDAVESLEHDRSLRALLALIMATVRTNHFQRGADGLPKPSLSLKLAPRRLGDLPEPRPLYEIFVHSPRVEGVHLRFGPVARGGLRWSDREEDYRTEILGLVKAQVVKNAVIVPTGAKGGFVIRHPSDPTAARRSRAQEGVECYRTFVRGLLDLTDNLQFSPAPSVVPPGGTVRHDGDDPYLVVAADKGTATFSDLANEISAEYGYWLGDAFASGGSAGYDHKALGITARGAWESVRSHFGELGTDVDTQEITAVGIGDMSGDVFGNGMLLSDRIRLVAAFDHRHVFLDPDPDPAVSHAERRRLFELPGSTWDDYDKTLLSAGGAVHSRRAKAVEISPRAADRLGLPPDRRTMTPDELVHAVLRAPVDLLWNGGIGTYVKAPEESHTDVGDRANDTVRVDADDLRCRVIGEGGNLGLTQRGRIRAALTGIRLNTDAIDNSAGVDCSDREVNIKILLDRAVASGKTTAATRDVVLADTADAVAELVLQDNRDQNTLLANARGQSLAMLHAHRRLLEELQQDAGLDRALEGLPDDCELRSRALAGTGLTSPEYAVLAAHTKLHLTERILAGGVPDDPWFSPVLRAYFPARLVELCGPDVDSHPLRREIIATRVVNEMVDRGGITFAHRAGQETGASYEEVLRAYVVCREVFGLDSTLRDLQDPHGCPSAQARRLLHLEIRRLLDRAVRWFLLGQFPDGGPAATIARFAPVVAQLRDRLPDLAVGGDLLALRRRTERFVAAGVPHDRAVQGACLLTSFALLDLVLIAETADLPAAEVARVYFTVRDRYGVEELLEAISRLDKGERWSSLARAALRQELYAALRSLTAEVLTGAEPVEFVEPVAPVAPVERVEVWEGRHPAAVARAHATARAALEGADPDLARLTVAVQALCCLVRGARAVTTLVPCRP
ncbi:MAG: glutamate dehydrogenase [Actinomycetota bacterium]|nr:glutamate dehydrogenase [Actinomycetota bacterium]